MESPTTTAAAAAAAAADAAIMDELSAVSDSQPTALGYLYESSGEDISDEVPQVKKRKPKAAKRILKKRKRPVLAKLNISAAAAAAAAVDTTVDTAATASQTSDTDDATSLSDSSTISTTTMAGDETDVLATALEMSEVNTETISSLPVAPSLRRGITYMCSDQWRTQSGMYQELIGGSSGRGQVNKLFYHLGGGLYLEKAVSAQQSQGRLRLSLWYPSNSGHMEKAGGRFSTTFDFDALTVLINNLQDIEQALALSDTANFLGYALHIGNRWFVTVERDDQHRVNIRRWWSLDGGQNEDLAELLPSRDGLKLNPSQFKKFKLFLQNQPARVFPTFGDHVFVCDRPEHLAAECTYCKPQGILPMVRQIHRIMGSGELRSRGPAA